MKKLLLILLLFAGGISQAQKLEIDLTPVNNRVDALERRIKVLESGGAVINPPAGLKDCKQGPTIAGITDITSTGITVKFDADSVTNMKFMVTGLKVYADSIKPKSNTFRIIFPSVFVNGNYTLSLEGLNCKGNNSRVFTIAGGVDPPSNAVCDPQPTFRIKGFTNQSATIQFNANGLTTLTLALIQSEKTIKTTTYNPDVNTLYFPFGSAQPAGNYKIRLTPVSCTSENANQEFTIKSEDVGVVDPPVVIDPGASGYKLIANGLESHMSLTHRVVGDIDYVTDATASSLQSNYEYRYIIGSDVVLRDSPLKDYPFAANSGFRVVKILSKKGIGTINKWLDSDNSYYDRNAGQSFPYNASASIETGLFSGSQSGFINPVPATYKPDIQMPQWADLVPEAQLPKDHMFVLSKGDWPIDQVMKKGITHIRHNEIPRPGGDETLAFQLRLAGKTYSDVPLSTTIFGGKPSDNPTKEEVQRMINLHQYPDALHIGETMEQSHAIRPESKWLRDFNEGFVNFQKKRFDDNGIKSYNCFNYFQFWPNSYHLGQVSADSSKAMFRLSLAQMPYSNFSPGAPLSTTNLIMEAVYLGPPDIQQNQPYDLAFKMLLFNHMGYTGGVFLAGEHEWNPNNFYKNAYAEGDYYSQGKIALDPNVIISSVFISQAYGKVFVQWGGGGKVNAGRIFDSRTPEPTYWRPKGSTELKGSTRNADPNADRYAYWIAPREFPYAKIPGPGYYGYNGGTDICRFGLQLYLDTWGKIPGDGSKNFLSYRIDGGNWIEAANQFADEIINASVGKRGYVHSIHKDGQIAWYYLNGYADNKWHSLEVRFPNGRISKARVAGNGIHAKIELL